MRSGSREVARLRRDNFLIANIPTSMHLRIIGVKPGRISRNLEFWEIISCLIRFLPVSGMIAAIGVSFSLRRPLR